jgi:hypothetical protein
MKHINYIFVTLIALSLVGALILFTKSRENEEGTIACTMDALICPDGSSVGRTGPNCSFAPCPQTPTPTTPDDIDTHIASKADLIVVNFPKRDTPISSPITISGKARGYWFFEASFPISIVDWDGRIIGEGIATADGEWMTEDFVPFTATITYDLPEDTPYRRGAIILQKDNPSGLPENDNALEIPITFK